jgi:hypothetical protein
MKVFEVSGVFGGAFVGFDTSADAAGVLSAKYCGGVVSSSSIWFAFFASSNQLWDPSSGVAFTGSVAGFRTAGFDDDHESWKKIPRMSKPTKIFGSMVPGSLKLP